MVVQSEDCSQSSQPQPCSNVRKGVDTLSPTFIEVDPPIFCHKHRLILSSGLLAK